MSRAPALGVAPELALRANAVSLVLMYLKDNVDLARPLQLGDLKPRAVGHWGCTAGINSIWSALRTADANTRRPRLLIGTGHAGVAALACGYLEGSLEQRYPQFDRTVAGLTELARSCGARGGITTEVSAQYPGYTWAGGELGHAVGVAHGLARADTTAPVVVAIGDGELETATTIGAFQAMRRLRAPNLHVVINDNSLRMGGPSAFSSTTDASYAQHVGALADLEVEVCKSLGDLTARMGGILDRPDGPCGTLTIFRNTKGGGLPSLPDGSTLEGTVKAHKAPVKHPRSNANLAWLEQSLRALGADRLFDDRGELASADMHPLRVATPAASSRPTSTSRVSRGKPARTQALAENPNGPAPAAPLTNAERNRLDPVGSDAPRIAISKIDVLIEHLRRVGSARPTLVTSPDELSSNQCEPLLGASGIRVEEYLSEHTCLYLAMGENVVGRDAWVITYEAFADIFLSVVQQLLKQASLASTSAGTLNLVLTSLGWRNAFSHQSVGFITSVLQTKADKVRIHLPTSASDLQDALSRQEADVAVRVFVFDKYPPLTGWHSELGPPDSVLTPGAGPDGNVESDGLADVAVVTVGDYVAEQAMAARLFVTSRSQTVMDVVPLRELTALYRRDEESRQWRRGLQDRLENVPTVLLSSGHPEVVSGLLGQIVGAPDRVMGYAEQTNATGASSLLAAGCTWMQIADTALELAGYPPVHAARRELRQLLDRLHLDVDGAWDDPAWFWEMPTSAAGPDGCSRGPN